MDGVERGWGWKPDGENVSPRLCTDPSFPASPFLLLGSLLVGGGRPCVCNQAEV